MQVTRKDATDKDMKKFLASLAMIDKSYYSEAVFPCGKGDKTAVCSDPRIIVTGRKAELVVNARNISTGTRTTIKLKPGNGVNAEIATSVTGFIESKYLRYKKDELARRHAEKTRHEIELAQSRKNKIITA